MDLHSGGIPDGLAQALFPALLHHGGQVAAFDPDDRLRWANPAYCDMMGIAHQSHGQTWAELMRHSHRSRVGPVIQAPEFEAWLASTASRRGRTAYRQFEVDLHDGRWILMTQTVTPGGWLLELSVDVSDLGRDHRELRIARDLALRASLVDPLTGIGNRSFVLDRLNQALSLGDDRLPCVALIDLDHFKRVNDWMGHAAGDAVLCHFAQGLQASLGRADACGRIGGEEFLLLLGEGDLATAEASVHRILDRTRTARPLPDRPGFGYTASAGLVRVRPGERAESVLARADVALYQAKDRGRDRCVRGE